MPEHTVRLVEGVAEHAAPHRRADHTHASGWSIDRLPDVDRAILRMAVFELLWADDVPDAVVIDEAVELAKALSTDDSPAYVNGVLGAILAAEVPTLAGLRASSAPRGPEGSGAELVGLSAPGNGHGRGVVRRTTAQWMSRLANSKAPSATITAATAPRKMPGLQVAEVVLGRLARSRWGPGLSVVDRDRQPAVLDQRRRRCR